jgi:hypothetical protein
MFILILPLLLNLTICMRDSFLPREGLAFSLFFGSCKLFVFWLFFGLSFLFPLWWFQPSVFYWILGFLICILWPSPTWTHPIWFDECERWNPYKKLWGSANVVLVPVLLEGLFWLALHSPLAWSMPDTCRSLLAIPTPLFGSRWTTANQLSHL